MNNKTGVIAHYCGQCRTHGNHNTEGHDHLGGAVATPARPSLWRRLMLRVGAR